MTTKFNKDIYAKMRAKKGEPLSNIGKKTRTASLSTSVEELPTLVSKRPCQSEREKEKADPRSSTIWGDERLALDRAHRVVTAEDLKVFFGVPSNTVASRHVHRLVQVRNLCNI